MLSRAGVGHLYFFLAQVKAPESLLKRQTPRGGSILRAAEPIRSGALLPNISAAAKFRKRKKPKEGKKERCSESSENYGGCYELIDHLIEIY